MIAWSEERGHPARAIFRRDQALPANSVLPVFDFNSSESFALVPRTLNIPQGETVHVSATLHTANGTWAPLMCYDFRYNYDFCSVLSPDRYPALPVHRPGDSYSFFVVGGDRASQVCYSEGLDRTLQLPPALLPVEVSTLSPSPNLRLRMRYTRQPEYRGGLLIGLLNQLTTTIPRQMELNVSAGYLGTAPVADLSMPDFSGVRGWKPEWGLLPNPQLQFEARGSTPVGGAGAAQCIGSFSPFDRLQPGSSESRFAWSLKTVSANGTMVEAPRSEAYRAARNLTAPVGLSTPRRR